MSTPQTNRIFLSYASQDLATAWNVYNHLTELGYLLWFDKKDLRQGHDWAEGITKGIKSCTMILVLVSKSSNTNHNVRNEVNLASQQRLEMKGVMLEPISLSSHLNYHLSAVQFVDAHSVPETEWLARLSDSLRAFHPMGYQVPVPRRPLPTAYHPLPVNTWLHKQQYRVLGTLGQGNFGQTYLCEDTLSFGRKVVVKEHILAGVRHPDEVILYPKKDKESEFQTALEKFVQEARRLIQLNTHLHPCIPEFFAFFQENGTAYYVMKFYEGQTLAQRMMKRGGLAPLPLEEALALLSPVLDALDFLHGQRFYHRDLKPDNLFRTKETAQIPGYTLLLDFGLTREIVSLEDLPTSIGHTGFAPSEQLIAGKPQGAWTDIYALAGTLFYLITGKIPNKHYATWQATRLNLPAVVTKRLTTFLRNGLADHWERRYQSIADLRADWEALCHSFTEAAEAEQKAKEATYLAAKQRETLRAKQELAELQAEKAAMDAALRVQAEQLEAQRAALRIAPQALKPETSAPAASKPKTSPAPIPLPHKPNWKRWAGMALFAGVGIWGVNAFMGREQGQETPAHAERQETTRPQAKPARFTNSIGMKFALVGKGSFMMGSPASDQDAGSDEKPQHLVTISKDFYVGQYEVTQGEWEAVMGSNPSSFKGANRPVENVSWDDAQAFIQKLNQKEGTNSYRLLTEAEWEYSARAGSTTRYSFGDDAERLCEYGNVADLTAKETNKDWTVANCKDGVGAETAAVGRYRPNAWGLYDMHGNVWEWVQDWYQGDYYKSSPSSDPSYLTKNSNTHRVLRGGSWLSKPQDLRAAYRYVIYPSVRDFNIGFRLAKTL